MLEMLGVQASIRDRKDDLYETPIQAISALLKVESLPHYIWEPACGRGAIAGPLVQAGHAVAASDLVDHGYGLNGIDFLMEWKLPPNCQAIVTNPPFKLANEFVRHAIDLCPLVIMLLRLSFIESEIRSDILDNGKLSRVYCFKKRLPMMHRDGWTGPKTEHSSMVFAWFVWDRAQTGPTLLSRISW